MARKRRASRYGVKAERAAALDTLIREHQERAERLRRRDLDYRAALRLGPDDPIPVILGGCGGHARAKPGSVSGARVAA